MKRAKNYSEAKFIRLSPEIQNCVVCNKPIEWLYQTRRYVITLRGIFHISSDVYGCLICSKGKGCIKYKPFSERTLVLKNYSFGLDVIAFIGELYFSDNYTVIQIHKRLRNEYNLDISLREVEYLTETYLGLVTAVAKNNQDLLKKIEENGGILLAIDGVQPEKGNETLWILEDLLTGNTLLAKNLLSSTTDEIKKMIEEIKRLGFPILGVISDAKREIRLACEQTLQGVPHQYCQYHYLKDISSPAIELDKELKKEVKKKIRGIREVERKINSKEEIDSVEKEVVNNYCIALRETLLTDGKYPLDPGGIKCYERIEEIGNSIENSLKKRKVLI